MRETGTISEGNRRSNGTAAAHTKSASRIRRERQLRRRILLTVCAVLLGIAASLTLGSFLSRANDGSAPVIYKYYTSIMIMPGDSLWSLADSYSEGYNSKEDYIADVMRVNSLMEEEIHAGDYLVLPYYSSEYK